MSKPKSKKIEIWQKANTHYAGTTAVGADKLLRTYEGEDAEKNAKSFLNRKDRKVIFYSKVVGKDETPEPENTPDPVPTTPAPTPAPAATPPAPIEDKDDDNDEWVDEYNELTTPVLLEEVKARGLKANSKTTKPNLIILLEKYDEDHPEEEGRG